MSIYKDCDIRGVYPTEIDEQKVYAVGRALATLHPGARLAVGGDVRLSTPALKAALIRGLVEGGAAVTDIGTVPTPALYWALRHLDLAGGATVTASHNPPEYNGIKFMFGDLPVTREAMDAVRSAVEAGSFSEGAGSCAKRDILPEYEAGLAARFGGLKPMKVVVDAGNGAMSEVAPRVFERCGHRVVRLFCEPDGRFPGRDPNPAEYSHLGAVCEKVRSEGADFGVAFDGDGDRAVFIDETGQALMNEKTLVLFIRRLLADRPTPVVYDQKSSSAIRRAVLAMGGTPVPERSGHAFIKRRFLEVGAAIAGEVSGHFFFGELGYDDGLFAALLMAQLLGEAGKTLSQLTADIVCPPITPDLRMPCPYAQQQRWLERVEALADRFPCAVSHLDGVRLEFEDGWILMRKSVTAEQVTLRAEADTPQRLSELLDMVRQVLPR